MSGAWRYLISDGAGAAAGLACDEALMAAHSRTGYDAPPVLRLYTYASHAALCGRYQHLEAEIDVAACRRTGTAYNRRPTGGGAIVMGAGQLGVAVATRAPARERPKALLRRYASGIVAGLARLGIEASFGGKNDLKVGDRKIAGLGLYLDDAGALLFHASVLADLDIPFMLDVLRIPAAKLGDRAAAAVSARVTTVTVETGKPRSGAEVRELVAAGFAEALGVRLAPDEPSDDEARRTDELIAVKYGRDDWVDQQRPQQDANGTVVAKTPEGLIRVYVALSGDTIKSVLFAGDFNLVPPPLARFEAALKWSRLDRGSLESLAAGVCGSETGLGITPQELAAAVYAAGRRAKLRVVAVPERTGSCYFPESEPALTGTERGRAT